MTDSPSLVAGALKPSGRAKTIVLCASVALFCLSAAYMAKGFYHMTLDKTPKVPCDMFQRWREQQYTLRGENFYEVRFRWDAEQAGLPIPPTAHPAELDEELGLPVAGYAPWSYFTGAALFWPSHWMAARYYFALVSAAALIVIGCWAFHVGRPYGNTIGLFFAASTLAMGSISYTLGNGQYGIFVLACLALTHWFDERGQPVLAGIALAASLVKPTMTLPFLLCFLVKGRWRCLAAAAVYTVVGSCFTWWCTGTDPITMLGQMHAASLTWYDFSDSQDLFTLIGQNQSSLFGVDRALAMKIVAVGVSGIAMVLLLAWRRAPMLTLLSIAAVAGRLWTYHRNYDNTMLALLLLALALAALQTQSKIALGWFLAMGVTLWLPPRIADIHSLWLVVPMLTVWLGALAAGLYYCPRTAPKLAAHASSTD